MDINTLRIPYPLPRQENTKEEKQRPQKKETQEKFLKGPVPMSWLEKAGKLNGKTLHTAIVIWHLAGMMNKTTVRLSSKLLSNFGVDRFAKYRAIHALEQAKLISVSRIRGQNPLVTILLVPTDNNKREQN